LIDSDRRSERIISDINKLKNNDAYKEIKLT